MTDSTNITLANTTNTSGTANNPMDDAYGNRVLLIMAAIIGICIFLGVRISRACREGDCDHLPENYEGYSAGSLKIPARAEEEKPRSTPINYDPRQFKKKFQQPLLSAPDPIQASDLDEVLVPIPIDDLSQNDPRSLHL